jgi:hypothetical protein
MRKMGCRGTSISSSCDDVQVVLLLQSIDGMSRRETTWQGRSYWMKSGINLGCGWKSTVRMRCETTGQTNMVREIGVHDDNKVARAEVEPVDVCRTIRNLIVVMGYFRERLTQGPVYQLVVSKADSELSQ